MDGIRSTRSSRPRADLLARQATSRVDRLRRRDDGVDRCVTAQGRRRPRRPRVAADAATLRERARARPTAGSSACGSCATAARRCASGSRIATIRCGGSPSSTCTRCAGSTRAVSRDAGARGRRATAHGAARLRVETGATRVRATPRTAFGRAHGVPVDVAATRRRAPARTRWPSYLVGADGHALAPAPVARPAPRRGAGRGRGLRAHGVLARRRGDDGPQQESYIGPVLDAVAARAGARRSRLRRRRPAPQLPRAALVGSGRRPTHGRARWSRRSNGSRRAPRSPASLDALAAARTRWPTTSRPATASAPPRAIAAAISGRSCGASSRRRAAAVAVVGARDGRSRRRARRARAARWS